MHSTSSICFPALWNINSWETTMAKNRCYTVVSGLWKWTRNLRTKIRKCLYQQKEIEKRMLHFKSTFNTKFIKWLSEIKIFFANSARSIFTCSTLLCMFCDRCVMFCLRHAQTESHFLCTLFFVYARFHMFWDSTASWICTWTSFRQHWGVHIIYWQDMTFLFVTKYCNKSRKRNSFLTRRPHSAGFWQKFEYELGPVFATTSVYPLSYEKQCQVLVRISWLAKADIIV